MKKLLFVLFLFISLTINAQKLTVNGYLSNMQSVLFSEPKGDWINDNLLHNRLNLYYYPNDKISLSIQARTRIFTGETLKNTPNYASTIKADGGLLEMSFNSIDEKSILVNHFIDRAYINYSGNKFEITAGRQRINWGQSFVWNPNDVFNTYSFFDFDYQEKPGADAIRFQYYPSYSSTIDVAAKWNKNNKATVAIRSIFNLFNYDIQLMTGIVNEQDWIIGGGWTGAIKNIGFTGEYSYIRPKENFKDTSALFIISSGLNYSFKNSLLLQVEFLYADLPTNGANFESFYYGELNIKNLAFTKYNIFAQISYPITPLLNANLSGMYYPKIKGYFAGPSFSYSLSDFAEFSIFLQSFSGEFPDFQGIIKKQTFNFGFLRLKYNF